MSVGMSTRKDITDLLGIVNRGFLQWKDCMRLKRQDWTELIFIICSIDLNSDAGIVH